MKSLSGNWKLVRRFCLVVISLLVSVFYATAQTDTSHKTVPPPQPQPAPSAEKPKPQTESSAENYATIKSPMIGTFYRRSGPDKAAFVEVGDEVTPGKVVCIIEAMKLFNEIESEISGKIVKVLVEDASPVEYDQALFVVEPA